MHELKAMQLANHGYFTNFLMAEETATCWWNTIANSPIGTLNLNGDKLSKLFSGLTLKEVEYPFTARSLKKHIPLFYQKLKNKDQKLKLDVSFKDFNVKFGNFDTDLIFEYTMVMNWLPDDKHAEDSAGRGKIGNKETIFYDEF
jgi:hypothetical protein